VTSRPKKTRWQELVDDLTRAIERGKYPIGGDLPSEAELCATYEVSRFTVRDALRRLSDAGLVTRRRGSGSKVIASTASRGYIFRAQSAYDLLRYAEEAAVRLSTKANPVSARTARTLGLGEPSRWVRFSGVRALRTGQRIGLLHVYLRKEHRHVVEEQAANVTTAIFPLVLSRYGLTLTHVDQTIAAVTLKPGEARRLGTDAGTAGLKIVRRFIDDRGEPIEVSENIHAADSFEYKLRLDAVPFSTA